MHHASTLPLVTIESRKFQLMARIAELQDIDLLVYLESILLKDSDLPTPLLPEEWQMVRERLTQLRKNPDSLITLEELIAKLN